MTSENNSNPLILSVDHIDFGECIFSKQSNVHTIELTISNKGNNGVIHLNKILLDNNNTIDFPAQLTVSIDNKSDIIIPNDLTQLNNQIIICPYEEVHLSVSLIIVVPNNEYLNPRTSYFHLSNKMKFIYTINDGNEQLNQSINVFALCCMSILHTDDVLLDFNDCKTNELYKKNMQLWNRSECPLNFNIKYNINSSVDLQIIDSNNNNVINNVDANRIDMFATSKLQVLVKANSPGFYNLVFEVNNLNNPDNSIIVQLRVDVKENDFYRKSSDVLLESDCYISDYDVFDFGECYFNSHKFKVFTIKNNLPYELNITLSSENDEVYFDSELADKNYDEITPEFIKDVYNITQSPDTKIPFGIFTMTKMILDDSSDSVAERKTQLSVITNQTQRLDASKSLTVNTKQSTYMESNFNTPNSPYEKHSIESYSQNYLIESWIDRKRNDDNNSSIVYDASTLCGLLYGNDIALNCKLSKENYSHINVSTSPHILSWISKDLNEKARRFIGRNNSKNNSVSVPVTPVNIDNDSDFKNKLPLGLFNYNFPDSSTICKLLSISLPANTFFKAKVIYCPKHADINPGTENLPILNIYLSRLYRYFYNSKHYHRLFNYMESNSVNKFSYTCQSKCVVSYLVVDPIVYNLGECSVGEFYSATFTIQNKSPIETEISIYLESETLGYVNAITCDQSNNMITKSIKTNLLGESNDNSVNKFIKKDIVVKIPSNQSIQIQFEYVAQVENTNYKRNIILLNHFNPYNHYNIVVHAKNIDTQQVLLHSSYYKILTSNNKRQQQIYLDICLYNMPNIRSFRIRNIHNQEVFLELSHISENPEVEIEIYLINPNSIDDQISNKTSNESTNILSINPLTNKMGELRMRSNSFQGLNDLKSVNKQLQYVSVDDILDKTKEKSRLSFPLDRSIDMKSSIKSTEVNERNIYQSNYLDLAEQPGFPFSYIERELDKEKIIEKKIDKSIESIIRNVQNCYSYINSLSNSFTNDVYITNNNITPIYSKTVKNIVSIPIGSIFEFVIIYRNSKTTFDDKDLALLTSSQILKIKLLPLDMQAITDIKPRNLLIRMKLIRSNMIVMQKNINFGKIYIGDTSTRTLTITNRSSVPCFYSIDKSGSISSGFLHIINGQKGRISSKSSINIEFLFKPFISGIFDETLYVYNILDPLNTQEIVIKANVLKPENFILSPVTNNLCNDVFRKLTEDVIFNIDIPTDKSLDTEKDSYLRLPDYINPESSLPIVHLKDVYIGEISSNKIRFRLRNTSLRARKLIIDVNHTNAITLANSYLNNQSYGVNSNESIDSITNNITTIHSDTSILILKCNFEYKVIDNQLDNKLSDENKQKLYDQLEKFQQKLKIAIRKNKIEKINKYTNKINDLNILLSNHINIDNRADTVVDEDTVHNVKTLAKSDVSIHVQLNKQNEIQFDISISVLPGFAYRKWDGKLPFIGYLRVFESKNEEIVKTVPFLVNVKSNEINDLLDDQMDNSITHDCIFNRTTIKNFSNDLSNIPFISHKRQIIFSTVAQWSVTPTKFIYPTYRTFSQHVLGASIKLVNNKQNQLYGSLSIDSLQSQNIMVYLCIDDSVIDSLTPDYLHYDRSIHGDILLSIRSRLSNQPFIPSKSITFQLLAGDKINIDIYWNNSLSNEILSKFKYLLSLLSIQSYNNNNNYLLYIPIITKLHHESNFELVDNVINLGDQYINHEKQSFITIENLHTIDKFHYITVLGKGNYINKRNNFIGEIFVKSRQTGVILPNSSTSVHIMYKSYLPGKFEQDIWIVNINDAFDTKKCTLSCNNIVDSSDYLIFSGLGLMKDVLDIGFIQLPYYNSKVNYAFNQPYKLELYNTSSNDIIVKVVTNLKNQCLIYVDETCQTIANYINLPKNSNKFLFITFKLVEKNMNSIDKLNLLEGKQINGGIRFEVFLSNHFDESNNGSDSFIDEEKIFESSLNFSVILGVSSLNIQVVDKNSFVYLTYDKVDLSNYSNATSSSSKLYSTLMNQNIINNYNSLNGGSFENKDNQEINYRRLIDKAIVVEVLVNKISIENISTRFSTKYQSSCPFINLEKIHDDIYIKELYKNEPCIYLSSKSFTDQITINSVEIQYIDVVIIYNRLTNFGLYKYSMQFINIMTNEETNIPLSIYIYSNSISNNLLTCNKLSEYSDYKCEYPILFDKINSNKYVALGSTVKQLFTFTLVNNSMKAITISPVSDLPIKISINVYESNSNQYGSNSTIRRGSLEDLINHRSLLSLPDGKWKGSLYKCGETVTINPNSQINLSATVNSSFDISKEFTFKYLENDKQDSGKSIPCQGIIGFVSSNDALNSFFEQNTSNNYSNIEHYPIISIIRLYIDLIYPKIKVINSNINIGSVRCRYRKPFGCEIENLCDIDIPISIDHLPSWIILDKSSEKLSERYMDKLIDKQIDRNIERSSRGTSSLMKIDNSDNDSINYNISEDRMSISSTERLSDRIFEKFINEKTVESPVGILNNINNPSIDDIYTLRNINQTIRSNYHHNHDELYELDSSIYSSSLSIAPFDHTIFIPKQSTYTIQFIAVAPKVESQPLSHVIHINNRVICNDIMKVNVNIDIDSSKIIDIYMYDRSLLLVSGPQATPYIEIDKPILIPSTNNLLIYPTKIIIKNLLDKPIYILTNLLGSNQLNDEIVSYLTIDEIDKQFPDKCTNKSKYFQLISDEEIELKIIVHGAVGGRLNFDNCIYPLIYDKSYRGLLNYNSTNYMIDYSVDSPRNKIESDIDISDNDSDIIISYPKSDLSNDFSTNQTISYQSNYTDNYSIDKYIDIDGTIGPLLLAKLQIFSCENTNNLIDKLTIDHIEISNETVVDIIGKIQPMSTLNVISKLPIVVPFEFLTVDESVLGIPICDIPLDIIIQLRNDSNKISNISIKPSNSFRLPYLRFKYNSSNDYTDTIYLNSQLSNYQVLPLSTLDITITIVPGSSNEEVKPPMLENHEIDSGYVCKLPIVIVDEDYPVHPNIELSIYLKNTNDKAINSTLISAPVSKFNRNKLNLNDVSINQSNPLQLLHAVSVDNEPTIRLRGVTPSPVVGNMGKRIHELNLGNQIQKSNECIEWLITLENRSNQKSFDYKIHWKLCQNFLSLGTTYGVVNGGDSMSVVLYIYRGCIINQYFNYIVIENLTTSYDLQFLRISMDITSNSTTTQITNDLSMYRNFNINRSVDNEINNQLSSCLAFSLSIADSNISTDQSNDRLVIANNSTTNRVIIIYLPYHQLSLMLSDNFDSYIDSYSDPFIDSYQSTRFTDSSHLICVNIPADSCIDVQLVSDLIDSSTNYIISIYNYDNLLDSYDFIMKSTNSYVSNAVVNNIPNSLELTIICFLCKYQSLLIDNKRKLDLTFHFIAIVDRLSTELTFYLSSNPIKSTIYVSTRNYIELVRLLVTMINIHKEKSSYHDIINQSHFKKRFDYLIDILAKMESD